MKGKGLLGASLLSIGLCSIPALGYAEVQKWMYEQKPSRIEVELLKAKVNYMMRNVTSFLFVDFLYDPDGRLSELLPEGVDTKDRIVVWVFDNRGLFSDKSGKALLGQLKRELKAIYSFIKLVATDMDTDIVAEFYTGEGILLGYFYQGEYHLSEK